ncbi:ATP-binding protein [Streptomyces kaempferi]
MLRNLPEAPPGFVGRRDELTHLTEALRGHRLVTLTGVGGVGKSRLALHTAERVLRLGARGVAWADLWTLQDERLLVATMADALDFSDHTTTMPLDALGTWLADKDVLLVLDSCEHLLAACRTVIASLLKACPALSVLATSREPLGLPDEHVVPVGPLPRPPTPWNSSAAGPPPRERCCRPPRTWWRSPGCANGSKGCRSPLS